VRTDEIRAVFEQRIPSGERISQRGDGDKGRRAARVGYPVARGEE